MEEGRGATIRLEDLVGFDYRRRRLSKNASIFCAAFQTGETIKAERKNGTALQGGMAWQGRRRGRGVFDGGGGGGHL